MSPPMSTVAAIATGAAARGPVPDGPPAHGSPRATAPSESERSFALANRMAGSRAHALANHPSNAGGTGPNDDGTGSGPLLIITASAPKVSASNGLVPRTHW